MLTQTYTTNLPVYQSPTHIYSSLQTHARTQPRTLSHAHIHTNTHTHTQANSLLADHILYQIRTVHTGTHTPHIAHTMYTCLCVRANEWAIEGSCALLCYRECACVYLFWVCISNVRRDKIRLKRMGWRWCVVGNRVQWVWKRWDCDNARTSAAYVCHMWFARSRCMLEAIWYRLLSTGVAVKYSIKWPVGYDQLGDSVCQCQWCKNDDNFGQHR